MDGDEDEDIAIIRIEETKELSVAKIGSSNALRVGEGIVVIGNPLGTLGGTVTDGIVSALDREITIDGVTMTLLQTNAAINQGNSGGGLFNMAGRLVGIVNAKYSKNGIEGLGFAIPIDKVYDLLIEIIEEGYIHGRVTIGIDAVYLDRMNALFYFGMRKDGVYIISSDNENIKVGDRIVKIGDKTIASENDYTTAVSSFDIGNEVVIEIDRGGTLHSVTITVIEYVPNSIKISE
jgi:serine protease Do